MLQSIYFTLNCTSLKFVKNCNAADYSSFSCDVMMHCRHCEAHNGEADSCILSIVTRIHFWDDSCQQHRHHCHQSHHRRQLSMTVSSRLPLKPSSTTAVIIAIKAIIIITVSDSIQLTETAVLQSWP